MNLDIESNQSKNIIEYCNVLCCLVYARQFFYLNMQINLNMNKKYNKKEKVNN